MTSAKVPQAVIKVRHVTATCKTYLQLPCTVPENRTHWIV